MGSPSPTLGGDTPPQPEPPGDTSNSEHLVNREIYIGNRIFYIQKTLKKIAKQTNPRRGRLW